MSGPRDGWETFLALIASLLVAFAGLGYVVHALTFEQAVVDILIALALFQR